MSTYRRHQLVDADFRISKRSKRLAVHVPQRHEQMPGVRDWSNIENIVANRIAAGTKIMAFSASRTCNRKRKINRSQSRTDKLSSASFRISNTDTTESYVKLAYGFFRERATKHCPNCLLHWLCFTRVVLKTPAARRVPSVRPTFDVCMIFIFRNDTCPRHLQT